LHLISTKAQIIQAENQEITWDYSARLSSYNFAARKLVFVCQSVLKGSIQQSISNTSALLIHHEVEQLILTEHVCFSTNRCQLEVASLPFLQKGGIMGKLLNRKRFTLMNYCHLPLLAN